MVCTALCAVLTIIASVTSETFIASDILDGATYVVDIGESITTVKMKVGGGTEGIGNQNSYGFGFGAKVMAGTYAVIADVIGGAKITEVTLRRGNNPGYDELGQGNWTFNVTSLVDYFAIITIERANDVSSACPSCFTFDPTATTLDVVYAYAADSLFTTMGGHSSRSGVTLTAIMPTTTPTLIPTNTPTSAPVGSGANN
eukprot:UN08461